jgi:cytochrome c
MIAAIAVAAAIGIALQAEQVRERRDLVTKAEAITGGDAHRGQVMFIEYGCGSCHAIPGVARAAGRTGPGLSGIALQAVIAGKLENNPDNLQKWIRSPDEVTPGTAMPDLNVGEGDARDISAFLYTQAK